MARFRLALGPIPFYHQVYLHLKSAIDSGEWPAGHRVPPERELATHYGCSVITVRRALDELAREQRLERTRGRGTFVLPARIDRDLEEPMSFTEEMQTRGFDPETRLIAARPESATVRVAAALQLEPGSPTLFLERLRLADGAPLLLEQVHLPAERFPGLLASDLEHASLYGILTERYGTQVVRARETFEPVLLRSREAGLLGAAPRTPALLVEGIAYSAAGHPVEFGRTYVRGDRTRYYVERSVVVNPERNRSRAARQLVAAGRQGSESGNGRQLPRPEEEEDDRKRNAPPPSSHPS
ncbi:MAG: GntR family transcriptional regulator, N-acetylglucosamine utilization regulator [Chloroflexota bacterium]|nr:GntR family transcriptional regulator, N-acetylglucosamine utilization regulator [Chloroflexota bacterium]